MTEVEAELAWVEIQARLTEEPASAVPAPEPAPDPAFRGVKRRRLAPLAVAGGLAATVLLAYALLPVGSDPERSPGVLPPSLESASAAQVLQAAAENAGERRSLMPAAGEVLFWRTVSDEPNAGQASYRQIVREWIDGDGRGRRVEIGNAGTRDQYRTATEFTADRPDPSIGLGESWRGLFSISQLADLPTTPEALLAEVREQVVAGAGENADLSDGEDELFGVDFITLISTVQLLSQAPLEGDQRAALFEVLTNAPEWYRSDGAAAISIRNLGATTIDDGRRGNRLRVAMDVKSTQVNDTGVGPGMWKLDLIVDPAAGEIMGMREYEFGEDAPLVTTIRNLEVIRR